jgi:FkbM family methyltransferase
MGVPAVTTDGAPLAASTVASKLASLLDDPLRVVDVGCRWGFADEWEDLGDRCEIVGFEPDTVECERLRESYRDRPWLRIVPHALGATQGDATLYITRDPACSSVYPPIDEVVDRHPRLEPQRLVRSETIELITMDDWCADNGFDTVDLIKVDTQGSELDVLRGAKRTLESVSVVQTEVEFNPMYERQPLFGDVDRFLRERGFVLWNLGTLSHHRQHQAPAALRLASQTYDFEASRFTQRSGQLFWADAVFVREDMARTRPETQWGVALRQACLASALGLGELAGAALDGHVRTLRGEIRDVVEAARRLLAPPDDEVERLTDVVGREPRWAQPFRPERGATLDEPLIVALEEPIEGAGWREPHRPSSGFPGRFMGPGRRAWIDLPVRLPPACRIELVVVSDDLGLADALALEVNGVPVEVQWIPQGRRRLGRAAVPDDYATSWPFTRIEITTLRLVPRPGPDPRKLGLALSELRLIPPDGESPGG